MKDFEYKEDLHQQQKAHADEGADQAARPHKRGVSKLKEENEALKSKVQELNSEVEQLKDKWLRAAAELENLKRRTERERQEWIKFSQEGLLKEILPIVDNLERAIQHSQSSEDKEALLEGIRMIHRQLITILERSGVKPIEALHQPFDPSMHEAMMQVESEEHEPNTIVEELEKGYLLHDRLLRPSKVAVSKRS